MVISTFLQTRWAHQPPILQTLIKRVGTHTSQQSGSRCGLMSRDIFLSSHGDQCREPDIARHAGQNAPNPISGRYFYFLKFCCLQVFDLQLRAVGTTILPIVYRYSCKSHSSCYLKLLFQVVILCPDLAHATGD